MIPTFEALIPEYVQLLPHCTVTKPDLAKQVAARLLKDLAVYHSVESVTGVPALWLMGINERESSGNLKTYLGNGEPLTRVTRLVPKGRGPFPDWPTGAKDALRLDKIDQVGAANWNWARMCYQAELWNGWGYRQFHHEHSPYVWGGTSIQQLGKYTGDGHFDPSAMDGQLGTVAIWKAIVSLNPMLDISELPQHPKLAAA